MTDPFEGTDYEGYLQLCEEICRYAERKAKKLGLGGYQTAIALMVCTNVMAQTEEDPIRRMLVMINLAKVWTGFSEATLLKAQAEYYESLKEGPTP